MKNIIRVSLILIIFLTSTVGKIFAEETISTPSPEPVSIHLTISTETNSIYDKTLTVSACNSDNSITSDLKITAYCAILQSGIQNDWNWDWAPGAFLNSLGEIAGYTSKDRSGNDVYHYWSWSLNGTEGATGLNQYELQPNDLISLNFVDPQPEPEPEPEPEIITPVEHHHSSGSSQTTISKKIEKKVFDQKKAFDFLIAQQKENGSFGEDLYTDWVALSLASLENQNQKIGPIIKLTKYLGENKITGTLLTDYERHAMALTAMGLNPYNINGENYIKKITDSFDGKQFGDINEDNDDIFALIVLQNAGFLNEEKIIQNDLAFILNKQKENGSWDESVDLTSAGIQALVFFNQQNEQIRNALTKAREFLKQKQEETGGWNNASSTAWVIGGILALSEKPEDWTKNENTPLDYLAVKQELDDEIKGINTESKLWETAYVLTASSLKTWNQIMQKFEKPKLVIDIAKTTTITKPVIKKTVLEKNTLAKPETKIELKKSPEEISLPKKNWLKTFFDRIFNVF